MQDVTTPDASIVLFASAGSVVAPSSGLFTAGYVFEENLAAEHLNWYLQKLTQGRITYDAATKSILSELKSILTAASITPNSVSINQVLTALQALFKSKFTLDSSWLSSLATALSGFVAPNATQAGNATTVGGEANEALHALANITGFGSGWLTALEAARVAALTTPTVQKFPVNGAWTWAKPTGCTSIQFLLIAAGGGGSTANGTTGGAGGGGGGWIIGTLGVGSISTLTLNVGAGGAPGSSGGNGGDSSIYAGAVKEASAGGGHGGPTITGPTSGGAGGTIGAIAGAAVLQEAGTGDGGGDSTGGGSYEAGPGGATGNTMENASYGTPGQGTIGVAGWAEWLTGGTDIATGDNGCGGGGGNHGAGGYGGDGIIVVVENYA